MKRTIKRFVIILLSIIIIRIFIGEPCSIPSESMSNSILPGDWLWINKLSYGGRLPCKASEIPLMIPEKSYFVLGDNRSNSIDSRYFVFVPEEHIIGKANLVIGSFDPSLKFPYSIRWMRFFKGMD